MSKSTWTGAVNSDWIDADNWSPAGIPGVNSDVLIASGAPVASASIGTVNSITDSSDLDFESAGTNTVTTSLDDVGHLHVDANGGEGGTILNIGATLTNSGDLVIGNATLSASDEVTAASLDNAGRIYLMGSSANQALLDVTGSAGFGTAGVLSGYARLAGDSAIEFTSGEITRLAAGAHLGLVGNDAFIEDSTARGKNSALKGLASIGAGASFELHDHVAVSTTGALVNDGNVSLDTNVGDGGSSLTLARALTNSGDLVIGNATLSASDKVAAGALNNTGSISLNGSGANQALLDVTGNAGFGAAGVLSGTVELAGDSSIEFAGRQITSLGYLATLSLDGNDAFIEDRTAPGSNSALTGLTFIDFGALFALHDGASVSTTGALLNHGAVELDYGGHGGSSLTVAGALTNSSGIDLFASDKLTADTLSNSGEITLDGGGPQALLDVTTGPAGFGTAGMLTGSVDLAGSSAIEFLSGQISTISMGARLTLFSNGGFPNSAFIEDSTALGSNSALTGLTDIAGSFVLFGDAAVSTTGSVTNSGFLGVDWYYARSGSTLSIGGALTNTGILEIGNSQISSSDSVTAKSFVNSGTVDLTGAGTNFAALNVSGATTNNGSISIVDDTEQLAGAVDGAGSFSFFADFSNETANLQFDSSVSSGQTINEGSPGEKLTLKQAQSFAATISGFGTGDTIDAASFLLSGTTLNFVENSAGTGGTLTLHDGSLTAHILMTGDYSKSSFTLAPDGGTGTLVKFV